MNQSSSTPTTLEFTLDDRARSGNCKVEREPAPPRERVPRLTKLLALAIKFEGMLARGEVNSRAALARAGRVSRARLTQIMSLLELAPAIQEDILYMSCPADAPDPIRERQLRAVTKLAHWDQQQRRYEELRADNRRKVG